MPYETTNQEDCTAVDSQKDADIKTTQSYRCV